MAHDDTTEASKLSEEADDLLRAGKPDEAIRRLNFALDSLRGKRDPRAEARVLEQFARAYRFTGAMDKAEQSTRAALACWMKVEDHAEEARVLGLLASLRISQGALEDGEFWLQSSLKVLRDSGDRAGEGDILRALSALYLRKGELTQAEAYARDAIKLFNELGDKIGEARTQGTYAQMLMRHSAFNEAHAAAERCQELFAELGHKQGVTSGMQVRAAIMRREGRLADAEQLLGEMIDQKREMKDVAGEAGAMNTLGLVVLATGERLNEAERHFLRAIELFNSVNDTQNAALSQQNLADLYQIRGRPADAEVVLRDALKIHRRTGGTESQARTLSAIGVVLCAQGRIDDALAAFDESIKLAHVVKDHGLLVSMQCPWVELMIMLGETEAGAAALEDALAHDHPGEDVMLRHALPVTARIALTRGDLQTANDVLRKGMDKLANEPPELQANLGEHLHRVKAAADSGEALFHGYIPSVIDESLRRALIARLKESNPAAYASLDPSIVQAMES